MRRIERIALQTTAKIIRNGRCETALVENASIGGLKLTGIRTLSVGDKARVQAKGALFEIEIVWAHGMSCGARFLPETAQEDILRFINAFARNASRRQGHSQKFREMGAAES
ncbi:MAG: hypothetical protein LAT78_03555 [Roseinatronobacter sp.]|nr:hypothetical protein [Roseinatronobacter sp.]